MLPYHEWVVAFYPGDYGVHGNLATETLYFVLKARGILAELALLADDGVPAPLATIVDVDRLVRHAQSRLELGLKLVAGHTPCPTCHPAAGTAEAREEEERRIGT